jgi:hypothetical protein
MPGLTRSLRARVFNALSRAGMLLALAGLAALGLENVSSSHGHLSGGHAAFHHHLYSGPHEHHHDDHEAPAPRDCDPPQSTATISAAPALFQPADTGALAAPLADPVPVVLASAPLQVARPAPRLSPPRAPPSSPLAPGFLI